MLCVGGAISVDRSYRTEACDHNQKMLRRFGHKDDGTDLLAPNYYWSNEPPAFDKEALEKVLAVHSIDTIVTHTAPSFCELQSKSGLESWTEKDAGLMQDIRLERSMMDEIYNALKDHPITHWCYGHFHQSWHSTIDGIFFKMLDIMELYEIR